MHRRRTSLSHLPLPADGRSGWPWAAETGQASGTMPHDETWPQISIVTPSYNQGEFIEETIRSVLLQAYPAVEYIIIDGGSTDESVEIIKKYEPWLSHWVSEPDRGQSHGINKGLALATGKILAWLNSDDYLLPGALRAVAEAYGKAPDAGGWFGICQRVTRDGGLISVRHPNRLDLEGLADKSQNWVMQPACFFSAEVWKICGPLDTSLSFAMDFDLWLKIAGNRRIEKIDAVLAAARVHEDAKTRAQRGIMFAEIWTVQVRHGFERMAISQMAGLWEEHQELLDKTYKVQSFFPCRLIRPLVKPFLKRIFS